MADNQLSGHASFGDLARVFDDDDLAHFANHLREEGKQGHNLSGGGFASAAVAAAASSSSNREQYPFASLQDEGPQLKPLQTQQQSSSHNEFVSAYVVIDPSQPDRILVPHQLLTYAPLGCSKPLSVTWGPVVLPSSVLMGTPAVSGKSPPQPLPQLQHHQHQSQQQQQQKPSAVQTQQEPSAGFPMISPNKANKQSLESGRVETQLSMPVEESNAVASIKKAAQSPKTLPRPRKKKPKVKHPRPRPQGEDSEDDGKPRLLKPLTAYNFFYRDERDNIVLASGDHVPPPVSDFSDAKREKLLEDRWVRDPTKGKRKHRKTHGKMEFTQLSRVIAQRWKDLAEHGKDFYRNLARADWNRYQETLKKTQLEHTGSDADEGEAGVAQRKPPPAPQEGDEGKATFTAVASSSTLPINQSDLPQDEEDDDDGAGSETGSMDDSFFERGTFGDF